MKSIKVLTIVSLISVLLLGCELLNTRKVEKQIYESVEVFHAQLYKDDFEVMYLQSDDELKSLQTKGEFADSLRKIKDKDNGLMQIIPRMFGADDLKRANKALENQQETFAHTELSETKNALYEEKFKWRFTNGKPKLVNYTYRIICRKPCSQKELSGITVQPQKTVN